MTSPHSTHPITGGESDTTSNCAAARRSSGQAVQRPGGPSSVSSSVSSELGQAQAAKRVSPRLSVRWTRPSGMYTTSPGPATHLPRPAQPPPAARPPPAAAPGRAPGWVEARKDAPHEPGGGAVEDGPPRRRVSLAGLAQQARRRQPAEQRSVLCGGVNQPELRAVHHLPRAAGVLGPAPRQRRPGRFALGIRCSLLGFINLYYR